MLYNYKYKRRYDCNYLIEFNFYFYFLIFQNKFEQNIKKFSDFLDFNSTQKNNHKKSFYNTKNFYNEKKNHENKKSFYKRKTKKISEKSNTEENIILNNQDILKTNDEKSSILELDGMKTTNLIIPQINEFDLAEFDINKNISDEKEENSSVSFEECYDEIINHPMEETEDNNKNIKLNYEKVKNLKNIFL